VKAFMMSFGSMMLAGLFIACLAMAAPNENPPPPPKTGPIKPPPPPKTIVVQLIVTDDSNIWMDGKRINLDAVNKLQPGAYTVDDIRGSQGVLTYLGLYSAKAPEKPAEPEKTEKPAPKETKDK
jgi:hypothetical protein